MAGMLDPGIQGLKSGFLAISLKKYCFLAKKRYNASRYILSWFLSEVFMKFSPVKYLVRFEHFFNFLIIDEVHHGNRNR